MRTVFFHGMGALLLGGVLAVGCGSDDSGGSGNTGNTGGSSTGGQDSSTGGQDGSTGGQDGSTGGQDGTGGDGGADGQLSVDLATTLLVPNGSNLYGLTYSADGKLYVSGTVEDGDASSVGLWRFQADGTLDESFGEGGVAIQDLGSGGDTSHGVVELASGELVVQGANNGRIYLMKFDSDGNIVGTPTFVHFGWSEEDLDVMTTPPFVDWPVDQPPTYSSWGIALDSAGGDEKIVVFAQGAPKKIEDTSGGAGGAGGDDDEQRTDDDRWVARVLASDFSADATFNGGQPVSIDVDGAGLKDNARRGIVEADGTILSAGYTNFGEGNHVALIRLTPAGELDTTFGFGTDTNQDGVTRFQPFTGTGAMAEAYAAVKAGDRYVTTGYGVSNTPVPTAENDVVSFGVLADGLDASFGDAGGFSIQSEEDPTLTWEGGRQHRDNGRDLVTLPDQRTLQVGCYNDYAAVFLVQEDGGLDEGFEDYGMLVLDASSDYATHEKPFFKVALSADGTQLAASTQGGLLALFDLSQD